MKHKGKVVRGDRDRGFFFVRPDQRSLVRKHEGDGVFLHASNVLDPVFASTIDIHTRVAFELDFDARGRPIAINVSDTGEE